MPNRKEEEFYKKISPKLSLRKSGIKKLIKLIT